MDDKQIETQISNVVSSSPVTTASTAKKKITYKQTPMEEAIQTLSSSGVSNTQLAPADITNPDAGSVVNTTRTAPGVNTKQHVNNGFPDSVTLVSSGGDAYIGGSVSPNSSVRASLRPMDKYAGDPFWLESRDRFIPVNPWTVKMSILNEPAKVGTIDVDKAAAGIARTYAGVPEEDFFGYEYVPRDDYKESWWSAFWGDYEQAAANTVANLRSAVVGAHSDEEAAKTPQQRAQENREAEGYVFNFFRRKAQQYLDYYNQLEPIPRGRGAEISGVAGSGLFSRLPMLASIPLGPAGWILGSIAEGALSAVETLETRDAVLATGGSVDEAQKAQWKHLGFIGATELLSNMAGQGATRGLIRGAINRGASRALTRVVGGAAELAIAGTVDAGTEVYQDKVGNILSGRAGYESLYGWSREDWNTFWGTLLLGALGAGGGVVEATQEHNRVTQVSDDYLALVANLKKRLVDSAESRGTKVSPEVLSRIDALAMEVYRDPEAIIDEDMRAVAQGFYNKLSELPPEVIERARALTPEQLTGLSENAFKELDARVMSQPWWNNLSDAEKQVVLGQMRAGAYVGALWFGQSPSDVVVPNVTAFNPHGDYGWFGTPEQLREGVFNVGKTIAESEVAIMDNINTALNGELDTNGDLVLALRDEFAEMIPGRKAEHFGKNTKIRKRARELLSQQDLTQHKKYIESYLDWKRLVDETPSAGSIGVANDITDNSSPYNDMVVNPAYSRDTVSSMLERLDSFLHEFSHANDWRVTDKQISDLVDFVKWYVRPIAEVFGGDRANMVSDVIVHRYEQGESGDRNTLAFERTPYTSVANITENRAQAVGRLLEDAKDYIGLTGKPAQYIQAANAILKGMNETAPLPAGLSLYVEGLQDYVRRNSDVINRIRDKVPAERMNAAIKSYMGGNKEIDWQGITPATLADFAEAANTMIDANALEYALNALGDTNMEDFVDKARRDWDRAWKNFYKENPDIAEIRKRAQAAAESKIPTETDVIVEERETEIDGGINPEEAEGVGIEDWDEDTSLMFSRGARPDDTDPLKALIDAAKNKEPSEFQKRVNKRFGGRNLPQSMKAFKEAMEKHEFNPNVVLHYLRSLDFVRGVPSFLSALGGQELVNQFDLVGRYDNYSNLVIGYNEALVKRLLPLFKGSRIAYEDYIRQAGVRKYVIDYTVNDTVEKRMVSKRELMSALLYNEQPDSKERIAKTVKDADVRKLLTKQDIDFAHTLRDYLRDEYKKVKKDPNKKVAENYWPIIDRRSQERGDERIINDLGRKETDAPIGLLDVLVTIGSYQSRVAGTKSGYFAALRRINSIVDYDGRAAVTNHMSKEDMDLNDQLDSDSTEIRKMIRDRLGESDYDRFINNVRDTITHRNDDALKDSLVSKIARNAIPALIYGKVKQFAINSVAIFKWVGYEHNTYAGFMYNLFDALLHPIESFKLANENKTIVNRAKHYGYNEYMQKNLSANSDNLATYVADWATKHDVRPIEALSDFVIHLGTLAKRILGSFTIGGDYLANVFGYAASYNAAKKALGSDEAAKQSLSNFINTRQSTANQAVKGLMVRRANRQGFWGNIFAFTGENTQLAGTIAQDIDRMASGDLSVGRGAREITAEIASALGYVAIQSGLFVSVLMSIFGGSDLKDEDWDRVYDNVFKELLGQIAGLGGPLTNAVTQPMANLLVFDYDYNGLSIPGLAEVYNITKDAKQGDITKAATRAASLAGVFAGLNNAYSFAEGTLRFAYGKRQAERNAGILQMFGFSEGMANRLAGIKKKKKKK